jgi:hypothetical protein
MEELISIKDSVQTEISKNAWGTLTTVKYPQGISVQFSQVAKDGQTVFAVHFEEKDGTYRVAYVLVNADGEIADILHETAGIQPTLFFSPAGDLWTSVTPYYPDKDVEITVPFRNRTNFPEPKTNRQFPGKYAGTTATAALFHDEDIFSDTKPDKLLRIDFKDGKLKAKKNLKIPMPKGNHVVVDGNTIHLYRFEGIKSILYRILDHDANVLSEQKIAHPTNTGAHLRILKIADQKLHYFAFDKRFAYAGTLTFDGVKSEEKLQTDIAVYNIFEPVKINGCTFAVRFNWETGNGWAIIQNDTLKNFFIEKETGYQCLVTGETLPLPKNLTLWAISAPDENTYSIVFYPNTERTEKKEEFYILNKPVF